MRRNQAFSLLLVLKSAMPLTINNHSAITHTYTALDSGKASSHSIKVNSVRAIINEWHDFKVYSLKVPGRLSETNDSWFQLRS